MIATHIILIQVVVYPRNQNEHRAVNTIADHIATNQKTAYGEPASEFAGVMTNREHETCHPKRARNKIAEEMSKAQKEISRSHYITQVKAGTNQADRVLSAQQNMGGLPTGAQDGSLQVPDVKLNVQQEPGPRTGAEQGQSWRNAMESMKTGTRATKGR